jgi:hypothetical protein
LISLKSLGLKVEDRRGDPTDPISRVINVLELSGSKINRPLLEKLASDYGKQCLKKLKDILK